MPTATAAPHVYDATPLPARAAAAHRADPEREILRRLARWGAAPLALGGVANAVHLILVQGHLVGAHHMVTGQWLLAHTLHVIAAVLFLLGTVGLWAGQAREAGRAGVAALALGLLGAGLFLALGVFTAFVVPVMVRHTPALGEASGPFFDPPFWFIGVGLVTYALGWLLLAWVTGRARVYPRALAALLAAGALLQGLPPRPFGPAPWIVLEVGGVLMAAAACGLAWEMWRGDATRATRAARAR
jgi:hypothetical protein